MVWQNDSWECMWPGCAACYEDFSPLSCACVERDSCPLAGIVLHPALSVRLQVREAALHALVRLLSPGCLTFSNAYYMGLEVSRLKGFAEINYF